MEKRLQKRLNKLLLNILGKNPAEFLLVGDKEGWIRLKDLHKVLSEEKMLPFLTPSSLKQYFCLYRPGQFEIREKEGLVRARPESIRPGIFDYPPKEPPPFLFCPIRPRAYFSVEKRGIGPQGKTWLCLCASRDAARVVGRRFHHAPLIIKVLSREAFNQGHIFHYAGSELYLTREWLEPVWLKLPPAPKKSLEMEQEKNEKNKKEKKVMPSGSEERDDDTPILPGSFMPSLDYFQEFVAEKGKRARRRAKKERIKGKRKKR